MTSSSLPRATSSRSLEQVSPAGSSRSERKKGLLCSRLTPSATSGSLAHSADFQALLCQQRRKGGAPRTRADDSRSHFLSPFTLDGEPGLLPLQQAF